MTTSAATPEPERPTEALTTSAPPVTSQSDPVRVTTSAACPECGGSGTWLHSLDEPSRPFHRKGCSRVVPRFVHSVEYRDGWWAVVSVEGASPGYWRKPRFTRWGARWAAGRQADKLNRLAQKGTPGV